MEETKLLFFDIDGTLCDAATGKMPDSARDALRLAQAKGHKIFLNTGRSYCNVDDHLREFGFDGMVIGCGAMYTIGDEVIGSGELSHDVCVEICKKVREHDWPAFYEGNERIFVEEKDMDRNPDVRRICSFVKGKGILYPVDIDSPDFHWVKLFVFSDDAQAVKELVESTGDLFDIIDRGGEFQGWEMVTKGCSKAQGIEFIRGRFGVPLENCYAFGDSSNDFSMLEHVPNSVAMGNAEQAVKDRCAYVTTDMDKDGIWNALKHFELI